MCSGELQGVGLVVLGLQEMEIGTSSVARAVVVEALQRSNRSADAASANGKWWADEALRSLQARRTCIVSTTTTTICT
jgi:hypothetical protein